MYFTLWRWSESGRREELTGCHSFFPLHNCPTARNCCSCPDCEWQYIASSGRQEKVSGSLRIACNTRPATCPAALPPQKIKNNSISTNNNLCVLPSCMAPPLSRMEKTKNHPNFSWPLPLKPSGFWVLLHKKSEYFGIKPLVILAAVICILVGNWRTLDPLLYNLNLSAINHILMDLK